MAKPLAEAGGADRRARRVGEWGGGGGGEPDELHVGGI